MTPQERAQFQELVRWMESKKRQQISYPLDTASQTIINEI